MLAGTWMRVPNSGTSNVRQSVGLWLRICAYASVRSSERSAIITPGRNCRRIDNHRCELPWKIINDPSRWFLPTGERPEIHRCSKHGRLWRRPWEFFTAQGALVPDPERRIEDGQQAGLAPAFGSCAPGCNCKSLVRPANPRNLFIGTSPKILLGRVHSVMPLVLCHSF